MHSTGNKLYQRSIAGFLLLLFCVIYSGKAMHTHEQHPTCSGETGITKTSLNTICTICEFQLSKDLELPVAIEATKLFYIIKNDVAFHSNFEFFTIEVCLKDRAPPVLS